MISSGIYSHLEAWFRSGKPNKLFHYYANWTRPKFTRVSQLDSSSKIMAGFYICGVCMGSSLVCFAVEIIITKWGVVRGSSIVRRFEVVK